jgi:type VI secretion system secreted protein Hcp
MAFDTFLDLAGVPGESTAAGMEQKIEISSFSWGASHPTKVGPGSTGMSVGRVQLSNFNIVKETEKSSPALFSACCTGKHFATATVTMRKGTGAGGQQAFLQFIFTPVMVESVQWSGSSEGDDKPTESVSFAFGKVEIKYLQQDSSGGTVGKPVQASWDHAKLTK